MKIVKKILRKIPLVQKEITRLKGPYIEDYLRYLIKKDNQVIIDVGANTGRTIDSMCTLFKELKIFAFEPTKELYNDLLLKYQYKENIKIFNKALGEICGKTEFFKSDYSPTNSILKPDLSLYEKYDKSGKLYNTFRESLQSDIVDIITFQKWYEENLNGNFIDIFKTDTQGYDYNVIVGIGNVLQNIFLIITEFHFLNFYINSKPFYKIIEYLYDNNFILYSIVDIHKVENLQFLECNALFVNKSYL